MSQRIEFRDVRHIVHVAIIVLVVVVGFIVALILARSSPLRRSFGQYDGHYRGDSIAERMNLPVIFQSVQTCFECHEEESGDVWVGSEYWLEGKHSANTCENCHSNCKEHVERMRALEKAGLKPEKFVITRNTSDQLCLTCHGPLAARPPVPKPYDHKRHIEVHSMKEGQRCIDCHVPHYPSI